MGKVSSYLQEKDVILKHRNAVQLWDGLLEPVDLLLQLIFEAFSLFLYILSSVFQWLKSSVLGSLHNGKHRFKHSFDIAPLALNLVLRIKWKQQWSSEVPHCLRFLNYSFRYLYWYMPIKAPPVRSICSLTRREQPHLRKGTFFIAAKQNALVEII